VSDEGIDVRPNRSSAYSLTRWDRFDNLTPHVFPLSGKNADRKKTPGLCRLRKRIGLPKSSDTTGKPDAIGIIRGSA
jgi:hypothetical protein